MNARQNLGGRFKILFAWLAVVLCIAGASPAAAQGDIEVNSADPPSAEQETFDLDVEITGDNFGSDSQVTFLVSCDPSDPSYPECAPDTGGIDVKKVKVRGPKKLVATIDVAADATVSKFDIEVWSTGRRGKGTELFSVLEKGASDEGAYNSGMLVRVDFVDVEGEDDLAVTGDGFTASCLDESGNHVDYDYADSHDDCIWLDPDEDPDIDPDPVKSDLTKNGGRWMFFTIYPLTTESVDRSVRVDFRWDGTLGCQGAVDFLDALDYDPTLGSDCTLDPPLGYPCAFHLQARITADRLFKAGATRQTLDFRLPTVFDEDLDRWGNGIRVEYVNPLFICEANPPSADVRYLQTMECVSGAEDVSLAELWDPNGSAARKNWIKLGECSLPMKIRLERVECTELCGSAP